MGRSHGSQGLGVQKPLGVFREISDLRRFIPPLRHAHGKALSELQDFVGTHLSSSRSQHVPKLRENSDVLSRVNRFTVCDAWGIDVGSLQDGFGRVFVNNQSFANRGNVERTFDVDS